MLPSLDKSPTKHVRSTLENLHAYAQLLDQPIHFQHISLVLDALVRYIQHFTYQEDPESQALWAASLLHKQKFIQDTGKQQVTQWQFSFIIRFIVVCRICATRLKS